MTNKLSDMMIMYRAKHRLSQKKLAELCGVSLQTINSVENELQEPTNLTKQKILLVVEEKEVENAGE